MNKYRFSQKERQLSKKSSHSPESQRRVLFRESSPPAPSSPRSQLRWTEKPQKRFFEKFEQVDKLMDEAKLERKKEAILKRVKRSKSYRACINLPGYRASQKPRVFENKNLKLESTIRLFAFF